MSDKWRKIKFSGCFKRKTLNNYLKIVKTQPVQVLSAEEIFEHPLQDSDALPVRSNLEKNTKCPAFQENITTVAQIPPSRNSAHDDALLFDNLQKWAVKFGIKQNALKDLMSLLDIRIPNVFPKDPRTFLKNDRIIEIVPMGEGQYWHNGFRECLEQAFTAIQHLNNISIKINVDGLPIYKSSKDELWPILFNIEEASSIQPMIIGIYCGKSKPSNVTSFLNPFVAEMEDVLKHGVMINGHTFAVSIRGFICDSPARAFIKGITLIFCNNSER